MQYSTRAKHGFLTSCFWKILPYALTIIPTTITPPFISSRGEFKKTNFNPFQNHMLSRVDHVKINPPRKFD